MRITDLPEGTTLSFVLHMGEKKAEFPSRICEVDAKKHLVYADPVMQNDRIVTFKGIPGMEMEIIATFQEEKPISFTNVDIISMKKSDGTYCYSLYGVTDGKTLNRRDSYRCFVGANTELLSGLGKEHISAIIRDVSATGFAFVVSDSNEFSRGQTVYCMLEDTVEEGEPMKSYPLYGIVVRNQELETGRMLYGCRLNKPVVGLDTYVTQKDRAAIRRKNGTSSAPQGGAGKGRPGGKGRR